MREMLLVAAALAAASCSEPRSRTTPRYSVDAGRVDGGRADAGRADAGRADASGAPDTGESVAGTCPPPAVLTAADVPAGYLAAETVGYRSTTDGDTAHFIFASGEQIVRLLYVNTEESHGSETTRFGEMTEDIVRGWISSAREIVVAVREEWDAPGQPDLDPYDRWLALVFLDGELLETRLIREGLSAYYTKFGCAPEPLHTAFVRAEAEANAADRGIWQDGHPTDYRPVIEDWIPRNGCRPNPFVEPYCP